MPKTIFWDTAAFVALGNSRDSLHKLAVEINDALAAEEAQILTTDAVLLEAVNTFSRIAWRKTAITLIDIFEQSIQMGNAYLVRVDESLWQHGWRMFVDRVDKDWSLTDCISFVVMKDHNIETAFTSDHHFEQAGYRRLMKT